MRIKEHVQNLYNACDEKFKEQFECRISDITFGKIAAYLHKPKDPSSLAVTRILFGLAMLFDIPDERGGATMERRWGDPKTCHFPLLACVQPLPMPYMALVYAALWLGAVGITLGYKYRVTSATFTLCYWYLFLAEKSYWNNHSYLFGLVALLLSCTDADCFWSLDAYLNPSRRKESVPYWNYFVLKYQFFILYFMAGLKKGTAEWLSGYSVQNLSEHWVFAPFKLFLTVPQTDYLVVHWFIFVFDLTVAAWMMWARSRHLAMLLCALFHLMNSRLFSIGMFPWVCLATMPLFYPFDWPKLAIQFVKDKIDTSKVKILKYMSKFPSTIPCEFQENNKGGNVTDLSAKDEYGEPENEYEGIEDDDKYDDVFETPKNGNEIKKDGFPKKDDNHTEAARKMMAANEDVDKPLEYKNRTIYFIIFFVVSQAFLPYSHFITKGYNNWTNGLYGYSWDMMVHTWEPHSVIVKVVDNDKNITFFVDPYIFTPNDRWTRHGDMVYQYAQCLETKIKDVHDKQKNQQILNNISIYVDVWCSMNGRFVQRMFDPKVDLLKATWSPFTPTQYLKPVLVEALDWRATLDELREHVRSWGEFSDVTFFADFPDYDQEKFIPIEVKNVSLTVLGPPEARVAFEPEVTKLRNAYSITLSAGDRVKVDSGTFHRVLNIGDTPSFYMYTYYNSSEALKTSETTQEPKPKLPIASELMRRLTNMVKFFGIVSKGVVQSIFKLNECH